MEKILSFSCAYIFPRYLECPPPDRPERNKVYHHAQSISYIIHTRILSLSLSFFLSLFHILSFIFSFFLVLSAFLKDNKTLFWYFLGKIARKMTLNEISDIKERFRISTFRRCTCTECQGNLFPKKSTCSLPRELFKTL